MKNYIANEKGDWATSAAFVKHSFERSIHHGRLYTNGHGLFKGKDEDLAEGLRLLGQGLHTLEDFSAHSNYVELALRNQGFHNVFPHCGAQSTIQIRGKDVFPLVTGTFGMVDFYHSVLGEATDHFTQSEVNEMDNAMGIAQQSAQSSSPLTTLVKLLSKVPGTRDLCVEAEQLQRSADQASRALDAQGGSQSAWYTGESSIRSVDDNYQGTSRAFGDTDWSAPSFPAHPPGYQERWDQYSSQPAHPQQQYQAYNQSPSQPQWNNQQHPQSFNMQNHTGQALPMTWQQQNQPSDNAPPQWQPSPQQQGFNQPPPSTLNRPAELPADTVPQQTPSQPLQQPQSVPQGLPGMPNFDPAKTVQQIYPILAFRDKVVRAITAIIEKIPGLEALVERITETLTVFVLSLLAPLVRPVLKGLEKSLQVGSAGVLESSAQHQFEPWTDPYCTDPTHSMLSKDHFGNILNEPAGLVAAEVVRFVAPRVLYAWQHPDVPVQQVLQDVEKIFHHPAFRNMNIDIHRTMFQTVEQWQRNRQGPDLNELLSSEGVKSGRNQKAGLGQPTHTHSQLPGLSQTQHFSGQQQQGGGTHFSVGGVDVGGFASQLLGGSHGSGQSQQQQHGGGGNTGGGMHFNVGGVDVGGLAGQFLGGNHSAQQQHHASGTAGGGNMANYLHMASRIPGLQGVGKIGQYANMANRFGVGFRGIDEDEVGGFGHEIGGSREFQDAGSGVTTGLEERDLQPMQAPSGYEMYGQQADIQGNYGQELGQRQYGGYAEQQQQTEGGYGARGYGGAALPSESYYRS